MSTQIKSLILLAATLIVGFTLGLFADATLVRGRRQRIDDLRRPPGLVAHLEDVIQPHDAAQADSIRPVLERLAQDNQQLMRELNGRIHARMDSAIVTLSAMLDSSQKERLTEELRRMPPVGPGGRGGRGRRGGPGGPGGPPPGEGPPPPPPEP
jgi:hypothetical protein